MLDRMYFHGQAAKNPNPPRVVTKGPTCDLSLEMLVFIQHPVLYKNMKKEKVTCVASTHFHTPTCANHFCSLCPPTAPTPSHIVTPK